MPQQIRPPLRPTVESARNVLHAVLNYYHTLKAYHLSSNKLIAIVPPGTGSTIYSAYTAISIYNDPRITYTMRRITDHLAIITIHQVIDAGF